VNLQIGTILKSDFFALEFYLNIGLSRPLTFSGPLFISSECTVDDGQEELVVEDLRERRLRHRADLPQRDPQAPNAFWRGISHPDWKQNNKVFFLLKFASFYLFFL
jgi:hypothetical protein